MIQASAKGFCYGKVRHQDRPALVRSVAPHRRNTSEVLGRGIADEGIVIKFGIGEESIPLSEVLSVEPHEWSLFNGIGHRIGHGGIGYIGSTDGVVKIKLRKPLSFDLLLGIRKDFSSFFLSLVDVPGFIEAVGQRIKDRG